MYKNATYPYIRLTIGTEWIGLTYYLHFEKVEQLISGINKYKHLEDGESPFATTIATSLDDYRLERSYLVWLNRLRIASIFGREDSRDGRPSRPLVDRVHDWTFRLDPRIRSRHIFLTTMDIIFYLDRGSNAADFVLSRYLAMCAAAFVYGGLHLLAWNAPFQAPIHGWLWKTSSTIIACFWVSPYLAASAWRSWWHIRIYRYNRRWLLCCAWSFPFLLLFMNTILYTLLYVFARVYLVVESFLSLAYLPESAMVTPNFSLYFPHIG
jgi:hypothetical protein